MKPRHYPLLASLTLAACIPHEQRVEATLDNRSDYPAQMTLELSSSSVEDGCDPDVGSRSKKVDVDAGDEESATLTWTCNYDVNPHVSYVLLRGVEAGKPEAMMGARAFGSYLETPLAPGDLVFWMDAAGIAHEATISAEAFFQGNEPELPDTEALLADPVRTDGQALQIFYESDSPVRKLGVAAERFKPFGPYDAANGYFVEIEGVKYADVYGHGVSGSLSGRIDESKARIICENDGCWSE